MKARKISARKMQSTPPKRFTMKKYSPKINAPSNVIIPPSPRFADVPPKLKLPPL
jgi:hypothetical protein